MATLSTKFKLVDDMSDKLRSLATTGQEVEGQLKQIGTSASSLDEVSKGAEEATEAYTETSEAVREYNEWHEKSLEALNDYINGVEGSEEELNKYIKSTETASESTEELGEKLKGTQKEHEKTQEETEKTSEKTKEYEKTTEEAFKAIEGVLTTLGIVAFLKNVAESYGEAIEAAQEFEAGIAKTSTIADTNKMSMEDMRAGIVSLSQDTAQSVNDLNEATYQALSAGVDTAHSLEFVNTANKLAVGGFTDNATAVDILTTSLNAYKLDVSETNRVSDMLITTQNLGKTTVDELASSMGRVIPSASAYNIQLEDLSTSYAILTANGIATAESTTYLKGMINELGDTGSAVSKALEEETGQTFSMLMENGGNLGSVIDALASSVGNDATAFANLWSSQEAGVGALSILSSGTEKYNSVLEKMTNSVGTADSAYKKMTSTSEYSSKALSNAASNFQTAVGNAMLPATNNFNSAMTNALNGLTTFVNQNPVVVRVITAAGIGFGVLTAAVTLYTFKTQIATAATVAFEAVQKALSSPVGWATLAVSALAAGIAFLASNEDQAAANAEELTTASKNQQEAIDEANAKYKEAAETYGEGSYITQQYKDDVDELTASFNTNKKTLGDLFAENERINSKYQEIKENDQVDEINNEAAATKSLTDRLYELAGQTEHTAAEKAEMLTIIDTLNKAFPDLELNYDKVLSKSATTKQALLDSINAQYKSDKLENLKQQYAETHVLLEDQKALVEKYNAEIEGPMDEYLNSDGNMQAQANWDNFWSKQVTTTNEKGEEIKKTFREVYDESTERYGELSEKAEDYANQIAELSGVVDASKESQLSAYDASKLALDNIKSGMEELAVAYDEAYDSALNSIEGQFSLWDNAKNDITTSTSTIMDNLDSQISYWKDYADNLENLQKRNISGLDELVASMDDGSAESAAALAAMASASDDELKKIVGKNTELQEEQDRTAKSVADLETDFSKKMEKMAGDAEKAIDDMDLTENATKAAKSTIDAYVAQIRTGISSASSAAAAVKNAVSSALNGVSPDFIGPQLPGHASGTDNAEDIFIAGEEGPELIVGQEGAKVFTASETRSILNDTFIPDTTRTAKTVESVGASSNSSDSSSNEKVIVIKLDGVGSIQIGGAGGVSKSEVAEILTEQIKPVLISVLNDEIYEEGDESYEY